MRSTITGKPLIASDDMLGDHLLCSDPMKHKNAIQSVAHSEARLNTICFSKAEKKIFGKENYVIENNDF